MGVYNYPSLHDSGGWVCLEAMAAGIPAVVADRASLPEIVSDAGIVVDPTQTAAIVEMLIDLDRLPHLREDYIQRGYRHVATYTWASCVDRLITAFNTFA